MFLSLSSRFMDDEHPFSAFFHEHRSSWASEELFEILASVISFAQQFECSIDVQLRLANYELLERQKELKRSLDMRKKKSRAAALGPKIAKLEDKCDERQCNFLPDELQAPPDPSSSKGRLLIVCA